MSSSEEGAPAQRPRSRFSGRKAVESRGGTSDFSCLDPMEPRGRTSVILLASHSIHPASPSFLLPSVFIFLLSVDALLGRTCGVAPEGKLQR